jgi:hypothetical protein
MLLQTSENTATPDTRPPVTARRTNQTKLERYREGCVGAALVEAFAGFLSASLDQER